MGGWVVGAGVGIGGGESMSWVFWLVLGLTWAGAEWEAKLRPRTVNHHEEVGTGPGEFPFHPAPAVLGRGLRAEQGSLIWGYWLLGKSKVREALVD